ncbi:glutamyl-tRNA reductase [Rhodocytophaga rosea]|uniref:Glutamyl-tRNA reductase n=1 Tax=Rhodocytophaga rosea TaxID=2704465 RepID=A0A6C0GS08_9BACT|nr:glutamyl-tRNA reductase [Rhodocytophaga rosea]QHT70393.1 glutamyl-tRNA reductase [Rhodocytophaga rosea]
MTSLFKAVSLSYKNAPIKVRECVSLNETECKQLLNYLKSNLRLAEVLVLSTCNRTEVYYQAPQDYSQQIIEGIGLVKKLNNLDEIVSFFDVIDSQVEAIRHLFYVSVGLESQVIGDLQIVNQVKRAYQYTTDMGMAGPFLHKLMQSVFSTSKRVVQETGFRDGAASVSYATVELVRELTAGLIHPQVLIIGLGEIGADVCKNLCKAGIGNILVANRTLEKSQAMAAEYPVEVIEWAQISDHVAKADVVISAVPGMQPFLRKSFIEKLSIPDYKYFIDLSMPRSIENSIETIPGVLLFNIDAIKSKASQALEKRKAAIPQVKELIADATQTFSEWVQETAISPVIHGLKESLEQIRQGEINRFMKNMTEEENKKVEQITKSIIQKILKSPVVELKAACKRDDAEQLSEALRALFKLEDSQI